MPFDATDYVPATVDPRTLETPRERLIYLRDFIAALPPKRFNMSSWGRPQVEEQNHPCGTAACIGGWAAALFMTDADRVFNTDETGDLVGLNVQVADDLFFPGCRMGNGRHAMSATPTQAAAVLTHLIETGEVDWSVA